jgi:hypothetical protein
MSEVPCHRLISPENRRDVSERDSVAEDSARL